jgi:hypothetical protein
MKKLFFFFSMLGLLSACTPTSTTDNTANADSLAVDSAAQADAEPEVQLPDPDASGPFGAAISAEGAIAAADVIKQLGKADSTRIKVKGNISACCQNKGCWMTMPLSDKQDMMVKFKDYGFFVPRNSAGKEAVMEGWVYRELVSVDELRHYAEDEGKPQAEIEKITKPEERITFMADGVIIAPSAESAH